jgi:glycosyltransferase involved in cell wall biosynthesis
MDINQGAARAEWWYGGMSEGKPTIVIVTNYYMPTVGGISTYVRSLSQVLVGRGYDVRVISFPAWLSKREDAISNRWIHRAVHELAVAVFILAVLGKILRLRLAGRRVIVHSQSASFCLEAGILTRLFGARVVHTFHSPIEKRTIRLSSFIPFANALVCVSEEHRARYIETCGLSPDTAVIPGGVDCEIFHPISLEKKEKAMQELAESSAVETLSGPLILFVGRVIKEKGAGVLLETVGKVNAEFPNAAFIVIGPLDQSRSQREFVEDLKRQIGQGIRYHLVGALSQYQLRRAYQASDVFVCPVLWEEASSLVVVEAMASGLPVIASRIGGLKSRVVEGINGRLVEPGDSGQLAEAILDYLRHPEKASEAGKKSRELAVAKYSVETMISAYEEIYQRVATA